MTANGQELIRVIRLIALSLAGLWLVVEISVHLLGDGTHLSDYGQLALGLLINAYTGLLLLYLSTGRWIPSRPAVDTLSNRLSAQPPRGVEPLISLAAVPIAWLAAYFLAYVLIEIAENGLLNPQVLGVAVSLADAARITTMFAGVIAFGVFLPLAAGAAFLCGWASRSRLTFRSGLVSTLPFTLTVFAINYGGQVIRTGYPPSVDMIRLVFRLPTQHLIVADLLVMWVVTSLLFGFLNIVLCTIFFIWSSIGRAFREIV
jgi:hypothetical protein